MQCISIAFESVGAILYTGSNVKHFGFRVHLFVPWACILRITYMQYDESLTASPDLNGLNGCNRFKRYRAVLSVETNAYVVVGRGCVVVS
jgi:hypothetical protein